MKFPEKATETSGEHLELFSPFCSLKFSGLEASSGQTEFPQQKNRHSAFNSYMMSTDAQKIHKL